MQHHEYACRSYKYLHGSSRDLSGSDVEWMTQGYLECTLCNELGYLIGEFCGRAYPQLLHTGLLEWSHCLLRLEVCL